MTWLGLLGTPTDSVGLDQWLNWGAVGGMVIGFISGWIVPKPTHTEVLDRAKRAEDGRAELTKDVIERTHPVLERAIAVINAREHFEGDIAETLKDVRRLLEQRS